MFLALNSQVDSALIRTDEIDGRKYWVAPLASLTSGVHKGNNGAFLYTEEDVSRSAPAWNNKPIVVYHPKNEDGAFISAANKRTLEKSTVGFLLNSRYEGKLRHEAWIDQVKAAKVDKRVVEAIENQTMMEVSTGLFHDVKKVKGTWNSESYDAVVCNIQPDHLALLPDEIGACSIKDGAGLLQVNTSMKSLAHKILVNETSHGQLYQELSVALIQKRGENVWLYEVYDNYIIFNQDGAMYRADFKKKNGSLEIDFGGSQRVTEEKKYVPFQVTFNRSSHEMTTRNEQVTKLIANSAFTESDREWLTALDDSKFTSVTTNTRSLAANTSPAPAPAPAPVAAPVAAPAPAAPVTLQSYIDAAPSEIKAQLQEAMTTMNSARAELVTAITGNAANTLTPEILAGMPTAALKGIAAMAKASTPAPTANAGTYVPTPNYAGQAPTNNAAAVPTGVTGLALPSNPFARKA